jgi:hypothetical protein
LQIVRRTASLIREAAMAFAGMNYLAILVAALAGWLFGAVWYGVLGTRWMAAIGKTADELRPGGKMPVLPLIFAVAANVVMAYILAGVISHLGPGQVTVRNGVVSAAFVWLGFVLTTMTVNNTFAQRDLRLLAIDGGHWLLVLVIMGAVIGVFGA